MSEPHPATLEYLQAFGIENHSEKESDGTCRQDSRSLGQDGRRQGEQQTGQIPRSAELQSFHDGAM